MANDARLRRIGRIGQGQFGVVDLIEGSERGRAVLFAVKTVQKGKLRRAQRAIDIHLEREVHLLASREEAEVGSSRVPALVGCLQTPSTLSLVLEYLPCGTLWDLFTSTAPLPLPLSSTAEPALPSLPERTLAWFIPQAVLALQWTHEVAHVVHRDVKAQNLLIGRGGRVVLTDFGSAARLLPAPADSARRGRMRTTSGEEWGKPRYVARRDCAQPHGTADYIAPEVLAVYEATLLEGMGDYDTSGGRDGDGEGAAGGEATGYDASVDWWSLGAMAYEMAYGVAPFWAEDIGETYRRITHSEEYLDIPIRPDRSSAFRDFIRRCLCPAPTRLGRLGPAQVLAHRWISAAISAGSSPGPSVLLPPEREVGADEYDSLTMSVEWEMSETGSDAESGESTFVRLAPVPAREAREDTWARWDWLKPGVSLDPPTAPRTPRDSLRGIFATPPFDRTPRHSTPIPGLSVADPDRTPRAPAPAPGSAPRTILRTARKTPHSDRPLSDRRALELLRTCARESAKKRLSGREGSYDSGLGAQGSVQDRLMRVREETRRSSSEKRGRVAVPPTSDAFEALSGRYDALARDLQDLETREGHLRRRLEAEVAAAQ